MKELNQTINLLKPSLKDKENFIGLTKHLGKEKMDYCLQGPLGLHNKCQRAAFSPLAAGWVPGMYLFRSNHIIIIFLLPLLVLSTDFAGLEEWGKQLNGSDNPICVV